MTLPSPTTVPLRTLLSALPDLPQAVGAAGTWEDLADQPIDGWRHLLRELPTDSRSFAAQYEMGWRQTIDTMSSWCTRFRTFGEPVQQRYESLFGRLSVLVVTLLSLDHSERYRTGPSDDAPVAESHLGGDAAVGHDCAALCQPLTTDVAVRSALIELYGPDPEEAGAAAAAARREWSGIDFHTLHFHRHGTTSFILSGHLKEASQGTLARFALKCILLPYLRIPTISRATRDYAERYRHPEVRTLGVVRLWASNHSWVLMDFVPGGTLAERMRTELATPPGTDERKHRGGRGRTCGRLRLDLLERYGEALFTAMEELEGAGLVHQDLSPSNIIVGPAPGNPDAVSLTLIDLGANYLYSNQLPGQDGPDLRYVAPEVRAAGDQGNEPAQSQARIDLYSVGQLLIMFGTGRPVVDGIVPDDFYAEVPLLARFLEDLLDRRPEHRLVISRPDPTRPLYVQLRSRFRSELEALRAAYDNSVAPPGADVRGNLDGVLRPFSGAPRRQRLLWTVRRHQDTYRDQRRNMRLRWLLGWSMLCAALFWLVGTLVVVSVLRNMGWNWGNPLFEAVQRATGTPLDQFPFLDRFRADDYPIPDPAYNLPMLGVAISFVLVCAKYYQALFAGLTPLVTGWRAGRLTLLALAAEFLMRASVLVGPVSIVVPIVVERRWWLFAVALGMTFVLMCNLVVSWFARTALRRAREAKLSTVPGRVLGVETYTSWLRGNVLYACILWTLVPLIYTGELRDTLFYMVTVIVLNLPQMYLIKCGIEAVGIRVGLGRACLAAERMHAVQTSARSRRPLPRAGSTASGSIVAEPVVSQPVVSQPVVPEPAAGPSAVSEPAAVRQKATPAKKSPARKPAAKAEQATEVEPAVRADQAAKVDQAAKAEPAAKARSTGGARSGRRSRARTSDSSTPTD